MRNEIINKHLKRDKISGDENFPEAVLIDSTSFCNLRCSMCVHFKMQRKKGIMPWEIYTKIIDEIANTNPKTKVWLIFFGDPFILARIKPSIFDRIAYAKSRGLLNLAVNSNGNLMDKAAAEKLIESGLDAIYFGIDAFTAPTYDKLRVGGDYNKVVSNILYLIELKKKLKANKPEVIVQFVEMEENKHEKEDFIKFWSAQGITVKVRPMVSWAGKIKAPNLKSDDIPRRPCHWIMKTMSIIDSGQVVFCAVDLDAEVIVGDVKNNSLQEIWNGKLKQMRNFHLRREFDKLPQLCQRCQDWQSSGVDFYSQK